MSWNKRSQKCSIRTKAYFSQIFYANVFTSLLVSILSLVNIIHPTDRCGMSRSWLIIMVITQVHLVLGTINDPSKMCCFVITLCHRCLKFWGSVKLACWLQGCPPELLAENFMSFALPYATSNVLENLAVYPTCLTSTSTYLASHLTIPQV